LSKQNSKNQNNESNKIHQNVKWCKNHEKKRRKPHSFIKKLFGFIKNCLVFSKPAPLFRGFYELFIISVFGRKWLGFIEYSCSLPRKPFAFSISSREANRSGAMIFVTGTDEAGITGAQDVLGSRPGFKKPTDFFKNH
jgi:hypothetical protein